MPLNKLKRTYRNDLSVGKYVRHKWVKPEKTQKTTCAVDL